MIGLWVVYSLLLSASISIIAIAGERMLGIWMLPRRIVWIAAIAVAIAAPLLTGTRRPALGRSTMAQGVRSRMTATRRIISPRLTTTRSMQISVNRMAYRAQPYVVPVWVGASLLVLAHTLRGAIGLVRRRRSWRSVRVHDEHVLMAPDVGPAVVGLLQPRIVLPEWALSLGRADLALMLRHEREHVDARDSSTLLFATLMVVLFPWNLPLWWMGARLRLAIEIDCDARVLRAIDTPHEYGMLLLAVGERHSSALSLAVSLAERRPLLEQRIHAMTTLRPAHPIIASLPFAGLAFAATLAAAQTSPPAAGIIRNRVTAEAELVATMAPSNTTLTPQQVRAFLSAHLPGALQTDGTESRVAIVLDANDNYVKGTIRAPMSGISVATLRKSAATDERLVTERAAAAQAATSGTLIARTRTPSTAQSSELSGASRFRDMNVQGLGGIRGDDIRAVETARYEPGEMGATTVNILIIKLK